MKKNMNNYIGQKAQQSLEALCQERPLAGRLKLAQDHFGNCEQYLDEAPDGVRDDVKKFLDADIQNDPTGASLALQSAIQAVFEGCGRQEAQEGR